jgi:hypothetical protein
LKVTTEVAAAKLEAAAIQLEDTPERLRKGASNNRAHLKDELGLANGEDPKKVEERKQERQVKSIMDSKIAMRAKRVDLPSIDTRSIESQLDKEAGLTMRVLMKWHELHPLELLQKGQYDHLRGIKRYMT